LRSFAV